MTFSTARRWAAGLALSTLALLSACGNDGAVVHGIDDRALITVPLGDVPVAQPGNVDDAPPPPSSFTTHVDRVGVDGNRWTTRVGFIYPIDVPVTPWAFDPELGMSQQTLEELDVQELEGAPVVAFRCIADDGLAMIETYFIATEDGVAFVNRNGGYDSVDDVPGSESWADFVAGIRVIADPESDGDWFSREKPEIPERTQVIEESCESIDVSAVLAAADD